MLTIYTVYKDIDQNTDYYQYEKDAKKAAMDYLREIAEYYRWDDNTKLRECEMELEKTGKCECVVYVGAVNVR